MHAGRNIALIGAFRGDFRLTFFNAALLNDLAHLLEPQGPNSKQPGMIRFAANAQVAELAPVILSYLHEAMTYAEAGIKPAKVASQIALPDELIEALDSDPDLAEAFHTLTPGRQKSYVLNHGSAKQSATRIARIAKFRDHILAGKGTTER